MDYVLVSSLRVLLTSSLTKQHSSFFLKTAPVVVTIQHGTTSIRWSYQIGELYRLNTADSRYHDEYSKLLTEEFLHWTNPTGAEPVPSQSTTPRLAQSVLILESALIYVAQNDSYTHSNEDLMQGKGVNDLASIAFEAGKMYRIRVINMSALASMSLSSHNLFSILTI
jgi:iron transport multicopper oxidase